MTVERAFTGTVNLEDVLIAILNNQIDSIADCHYDDDRANVIPSNTEGVAE